MRAHLESSLQNFLRLESAGGILLCIAAGLAILVANTPLNDLYQSLLAAPVAVVVGPLEVAKPLLLWINDGLMAVFFFLVGLELKREWVEGELADKRNIILPGMGALGGMAVPAIVYLLISGGDTVAARGWAIPAATDIAFALGVLALLGSRVPVALKVFLTSLAIFDDIGAILIIAFFYTEKISIEALAVVLACLATLFVLNRNGASSKSLYIFIGVVMWVATLKSGVHATLAGVMLAMFVPMHSDEDENGSPLKSLEHDLHSTVAFVILPVFAFANSGINLAGIGVEQLLHPVPVGIALGLFLGKQLGVFSLCWLCIKTGLAPIPEGMNWRSLYGVALLSGIGFTMSLFIGSLAFAGVAGKVFDERLGIIVGSLLSGLLGYAVLAASLPRADKTHTGQAGD